MQLIGRRYADGDVLAADQGDWALLISLLRESLPGIAIGSHFANRVPERVLRPLMAGTLALVERPLASDQAFWPSQITAPSSQARYRDR